MRNPPVLAALLLLTSTAAFAAQPCQTFHGRFRFYSADGQYRVWHIGTHHTFMPPWGPSDVGYLNAGWNRAMDILDRHNPNPKSPPDDLQLFADFTVCPTEPLHPGAAQRATIKSIRHPRIVPWTN